MLPEWIQRWFLRGLGNSPPQAEPSSPESLLERRVADLERQLVGLRWLALVTTLVLLVLLNEHLTPLTLLRDALGAVANGIVFVVLIALVGYGLWRWLGPRSKLSNRTPPAPPSA
jgi:hypothetical protein